MPSQTFKITRAPEEPPLKSPELAGMLYGKRKKSEWHVDETAEMDFHDFRNALTRLRFLDRDVVERAGITSRWLSFRQDPFRAFLEAPDSAARKIWELIKPLYVEKKK